MLPNTIPLALDKRFHLCLNARWKRNELALSSIPPGTSGVHRLHRELPLRARFLEHPAGHQFPRLSPFVPRPFVDVRGFAAINVLRRRPSENGGRGRAVRIAKFVASDAITRRGGRTKKGNGTESREYNEMQGIQRSETRHALATGLVADLSSKIIVEGRSPSPSELRSLADATVSTAVVSRVRPRRCSATVPVAPSTLNQTRGYSATVVYRIMQQTTGPPVVNRVQRHSEYRRCRRRSVFLSLSWPQLSLPGCSRRFTDDVHDGYRH